EEHTSELQSLTNLVCRLCLEFRRVLFRSEEHTSELQSLTNLVCPLLLEKNPGRRGHRSFSRLYYDVAYVSPADSQGAESLLELEPCRRRRDDAGLAGRPPSGLPMPPPRRPRAPPSRGGRNSPA